MDGKKLALAALLPLAFADVVALDVVVARHLATTRASASTVAAPSRPEIELPARAADAKPSPVVARPRAAAAGREAAPSAPTASAAPSVLAPAPSVFGSIRFAMAQAQLDPAAGAALEKVLAAMRAEPTREVLLIGYADAVGDAAHNAWLSRFRAQVVERWLTQHGVARGRLEIRGAGSDADAGVVDDEGAQAGARRVDVVWR
jgi:outer membrane protein OmpA-like peptidoglycan-associated protein